MGLVMMSYVENGVDEDEILRSTDKMQNILAYKMQYSVAEV